MPSDVDIANFALTRLGHASIQSLIDDSDQARAVNGLYAILRDAIQCEHPWNFNTVWFAVTVIPGAPLNPNFGAQYQLPPNVLKVWSLDVDTWPWVVEANQVLLTDLKNPVIQYSKRIVDAGSFPPFFVEALGYRLSADLRNPLTARRGNAQDDLKQYAAVIAKAKTSDGQEGSPLLDDFNPLALVRRVSSGTTDTLF